MANRLLGLCGPGQGPEVFVGGKKATAKICGLKDGELVCVRHGDVVDDVQSNGAIELRPSEHISFAHSGTSKGLICFVEF